MIRYIPLLIFLIVAAIWLYFDSKRFWSNDKKYCVKDRHGVLSEPMTWHLANQMAIICGGKVVKCKNKADNHRTR